MSPSRSNTTPEPVVPCPRRSRRPTAAPSRSSPRSRAAAWSAARQRRRCPRSLDEQAVTPASTRVQRARPRRPAAAHGSATPEPTHIVTYPPAAGNAALLVFHHDVLRISRRNHRPVRHRAWPRRRVAGLSQAMAAGTADLGRARAVLPAADRAPGTRCSGAVISVSPDAAEQASAVDQARGPRAPTLGPLAGIPVLIKDNISVAGSPGDRRFPRPARRLGAGRVPGRQAPRGGRGHPRQGEPVRVGELPLHPVLQRLVEPGRAGGQPARHRPQPVRVELGLGGGGRGRARAARGRDRDRRLDREPVARLRHRRHQADARPDQPEPGSSRYRRSRTPPGR